MQCFQNRCTELFKRKKYFRVRCTVIAKASIHPVTGFCKVELVAFSLIISPFESGVFSMISAPSLISPIPSSFWKPDFAHQLSYCQLSHVLHLHFGSSVVLSTCFCHFHCLQVNKSQCLKISMKVPPPL